MKFFGNLLKILGVLLMRRSVSGEETETVPVSVPVPEKKNKTAMIAVLCLAAAAIPASLAEQHSSCSFRFGFHEDFDNYPLSCDRSFEEDPIALCPYTYRLILK